MADREASRREEAYITFNTYDPKYQELRRQINKLSVREQSSYTDKVDAIAEKKIRRLVSED